MSKELFSFGDEALKAKSKLLVLSVVSWFIALTKALPEKVTLLGLDLSHNPKILGWFILGATIYLMIIYIVAATLELIRYYLPSLIKKETAKTTGDTLGLTLDDIGREEEAQDYYHASNEDIGTPQGELRDIDKKNNELTYKYKRNYIVIHNGTVIFLQFFFPIIFSAIGVILLFIYIICLK